MSTFRLILHSLWFHRRIHLAVVCGVAVATAILTGAFLVGDSMRGSLRDLTLSRLGPIDEGLVTEQFFRAELAEELVDSDSNPERFTRHFSKAAAAVLLRASLEKTEDEDQARANRIDLMGVDTSFWQLADGPSDALPEGHQIVLNAPLANRLRAVVGDGLMVRLPRVSTIPASNPLGRKKETVRGHRLRVYRVLPEKGIGEFSLRPNQREPLVAFVSLEWIQDQLEQPGKVNALFVSGRDSENPPTSEADAALQSMLRPAPTDFGLRIEQTTHGYVNITSDRMMIDESAESELVRSLHGRECQLALTYLANTIAVADREIPYSTISAVDFSFIPPFGPFQTPDGKSIGALGDDQIVLNRWAAERLQATPGDTVRVTYFEPESTDGLFREKTVELRLAAIVAMDGPAADPNWTPTVRGITDQLTMESWNPPFPFDASRISDADEKYWDTYRATPKAFVSLDTGRRLWSGRFGRTTSIRVVATDDLATDNFSNILSLDPAVMGFVFQPVKRQGLEASVGTTPFEQLFLGFSLFLIAAAVMLVALLFRLGVEGRANQVGIMLAVGFRRRRTMSILLVEGLLVAAVGSLLGIAAGGGYAALMLAGLQTLWVEAVVRPFLSLHIEPMSLVVGGIVGLVTTAATVVWSVRKIARFEPRKLLAGQSTNENPLVGTRALATRIVTVALFCLAIFVCLIAMRSDQQMQAGLFFSAAALTLTATLVGIWSLLRSGGTGSAVAVGRGNLARLALRNMARNPSRSTLTIGLVAAASFLIVAISAFRLDPSVQTPRLASGNGGFALVAETNQPIHFDLNSEDGRFEMGFSNDDTAMLSTATIHGFHVQTGDDASCLNLYRPRQPTLLGAKDDFLHRGGFVFKQAAAGEKRLIENPWLWLEEELSPDDDGVTRVPVILDAATAQYSLHLGSGTGNTLDVDDGRGGRVRLEVVGLLANSIFQGRLIIGEKHFLRSFHGDGGIRFFLVEANPSGSDTIREALERTLGDYGMTTETTGRRLARFLTVQNTYLLTFQTLGGLGLLLGTFGLVAVEVRSVLERRRELALLRAIGFSRGRLAWMVMIEHALLLLLGLGSGVIAASVAVLPHLLGGGGASIPCVTLSVTLLVILSVGLLTGWLAARRTLAAPLLSALRGE